MYTNTIWKEIWNLKTPGKTKKVAWKTLNGLLPCYGIHANRHIPFIPQCMLGAVGVEDIKHCLFICKRAKKVCAELGLQSIIADVVRQDRSGPVTTEILCQTNSVKDGIPTVELMIVAAWYL